MAEAVSLVRPGDFVAVGGYHYCRKPIALVRELIRQGSGGLTLLSHVGSVDTDLLLAAGLVKKLIFGYVGLEVLGLANNFRRAVEHGRLEIVEYGSLPIVRALEAAQRDLPFMPARGMLGSDLASRHPGKHQKLGDHYLLADPPLRPDVALIHAQYASSDGSVGILNEGSDIELIKAAKLVVVSVEQILSPAEFRRRALIPLPRYAVDAIVQIPWGAHPCSAYPFYVQDYWHLLTYAEMHETAEGAKKYLQEFVFDTADPDAYLERVGGLKAMSRIARLVDHARVVAEAGT